MPQSEPQSLAALLAVAEEHARAGHPTEVASRCMAILARAPKHERAVELLATAMHQLGRHDIALKLVDGALRDGASGGWHLLRGRVCLGLGDLDDAVTSLRAATLAIPDDATAHAELARALWQAHRLDEATTSARAALAIDPDSADAHLALGLVARELGRLDEATTEGRRALALAPQHLAAAEHLAQCLLLAGDLARGLALLGDCWTRTRAEPVRRLYARPQWDGAATAKTLLVHGDGRLGNTLMLVRYLPGAVARAGRVVVEVEPRLARFLGGCRALAGATVIARGATPQSLPAFDYQISLWALGTALAATPLEQGDVVPYLDAEPALVEKWRLALGPRPRLRVGVAWQGDPSRRVDHGRSFPLAALAPLAAVDGVELVSLQRVHGLDQLDALPGAARPRLLELDAGADAFVDTAAVMQLCDLVVTCDTSIAHLAGGLGRPTWVALKAVPEWRWQLARPDSPWYPTMRLFRQEPGGADSDGWAPVFARMAERLRAFSGGEERA